MHPRGRADHGSAPRGILAAAGAALTLIAAAGGCARPGNTPGGTPTPQPTTVTVEASAVPASPVPMSDLLVPAPTGTSAPPRGVARCATAATAVPKPAPGTTHPRGSGPNDAGSPRDRREQVLESQRATYPRRGDVPAVAAAAATECARLLQLEFTLRTAGGRPLDEEAVRAALQSTGLTKAVIEPGPRFATSTGQACIIGTVTAGRPAMVIAPLPSDGTCRP